MINIKPYILHLRPKSWPVVFGHLLVGLAVALKIESDLSFFDVAIAIVAGFFSWTVFLNGGTLSINSYFDDDDGGDIGYLDNPPPIPRGLDIFSYLLLGLGLVVAYFFGSYFFTIYCICLVLSILYSVPPVRLKARPGWDLLVNSFGYGAFTFFAGYLLISQHLDMYVGVLLGFYFFLFTALYPLTQIYQYESDLSSGDITLTVKLGIKRALDFSIISACIAFILILVWGVQYYTSVVSSLILALCFILWFALLFWWRVKQSSFPHKKGMYLALKIWAITDIAIIAATWIGL